MNVDRRGITILWFVLSLLVLPASGVTAGQPDSAQADVTFRTSVQEVSLELSVRDQRGRSVRNIKPEEVEIYENGVRQRIRSFRFVNGRDIVQRAETGQPPSRSAPNAANPLPAVNYICIVFHNLDPATIPYAVKAAQEFVDRELQPGTGIGLFSLGTRLKVLRTFTADRKALAKLAAQSFQGTVGEAALGATPYQFRVSVASGGSFSWFGGGLANTRMVYGADKGANDLFAAIQADMRRTFNDIHGMQARDQINTLLDELGPLPGRKTVLLLSTGLVAPEDKELFGTLIRRANLGQISIYALDVHGLTQNSNVVENTSLLSEAAAVSRTQTQISENLADARAKSRQGDLVNLALRGDMQETLRALAEGTGGFLIANTDSLGKLFQRVMEDVDTHYEAAYAPASGVWDGRFRKIEVKLTRPNLNVQSRVGYYALPSLDSGDRLTLVDMIGLAALNSREAPRPFEYRSAALRFRGSQNALAFELPGNAFTATELPDNRRRLRIALLALVKDATGQVVHKFSQEVPYEVPDSALAELRKTAIPYTRVLDLSPGRYTAETAVSDLEAGRVSVGRFEFDVPEAAGLDMSSVMRVQQLQPLSGKGDDSDPFLLPVRDAEPKRVIPDLSGSVTAGVRPVFYFVVYPDRSRPEPPALRVEFLCGGKVIGQQKSELPAPTESGRIPMLIQAPARTGACGLRITAIQGNAEVTRSLHFTVSGN